MRLHPVLPLLLLAAVTACSDDNIVEPSADGFATLQIVNAVPAVDTLGLHIDGFQFPIVFSRARTNSACVSLPAGQHTVGVRRLRQNTDLVSVTQTFERDTRYTLVFAGTPAAARVTVLEDDFTPPDTSQNVLVRFINASATAGDVFVTAVNAPLAGVQPTVGGLGPVAANTADLPFTTIAKLPGATPNATQLQVRLFDVGTTAGTPRATLAFTPAQLPNNRVANVIFLDAGTPAGATVLRFNPCT
jgi:hypothetical protein